MAYNPYYPYYPTQNNAYPTQMNVNPMQINPTQIPQANVNPTQPQTNSNLIWVQGEAGAKSYMVAPNTTVQLWDSETNTIYLKSADASGMPSMRILDYTIRDNNAPQSHADISANYVTQDDLKALERKLNDRLDEIVNGEAAHGKSAL